MKRARLGLRSSAPWPRSASRSIAYVSVRIERQSVRDEAQPADVILVLGAAEYRGRPSQVLRARLDHALELYQQKLAPRILTTGGAGGDPVFTEGGVGRSYLIGRGVPPEAIIVETRRRDHRGIHRHGGRDHAAHGAATRSSWSATAITSSA